MSKKRFSWMISPRNFISALGADYELMREAKGNVLPRFYITGIFILIIAITSFLSIKYAINLLFHREFVEIFLSIFLSLLFVLMYIFLINTFTKQDISHEPANISASETKDLLTFANISRTFFVIIMAFIISKPIEIYVFRHKLRSGVENYKNVLHRSHEIKLAGLYETDIAKLDHEILTKTNLNSDGAFDNEILLLTQKKTALLTQQDNLLKAADKKIYDSDYFTFQVKEVGKKYPLSWAICFAVILVFLLPGYLIYSISRDDEYFFKKTERDRNAILASYKAFVEKYTSIFREKYDAQVAMYSVFEDPPFNSKRKPSKKFRPSTEFFDKYGID